MDQTLWCVEQLEMTFRPMHVVMPAETRSVRPGRSAPLENAPLGLA